MKLLPLTFVSAMSLFLVACNDASSEIKTVSAPLPAEVDVAIPLQHKLTDWDEFTGRFEAIDNVAMRSRVTGYLVEKKFKDGQLVKKGDVLYVIDPRPFDYELQRSKAQYELAKKELERAQNLRKTKAISQEEVDRRFQEVQIAEATLNDAKLQQSFTRITAPIDGKISDSYVDVGNMIEENDTVLTLIVSTNPIHFRFEGSQGDLLKYLRLDLAGERPSSNKAPNPIYIKLLDEDKFYHKGQMNFVDNVVDAGTGTIQATAVVNNDSGIIYPGLFGRARLLGRSEYQAILLPENAINTDQSKKFVYVVNDNNQIGRAYVTVGTLLDNDLIVVRTGLKGDEKVVIDGIQRIRSANQEVTPNVVEIQWKELQSIVDEQAVQLSQEADTTNKDI